MSFQRVFSGAPWESQVGYCRALRAGDRIFVTGCAPVAIDGGVHAPGDPYAQTVRCIEIIREALESLGAGLANVTAHANVRDGYQLLADVGRAHGEFFGTHPPTTSMVEVSRLIEPDMMIEIEADAIVVGSLASRPTDPYL